MGSSTCPTRLLLPRRGYTYDEQGVRSSKTVNDVTTTFSYNGSLLMAQVQGSGMSQVKQLYSYDASGQLISVNYNGTEYYYLRNGQTDIVGLMDGSGTKVVEYTYDAWGKLISTTGTLASTLGANNPFRYRGYYYDTETGLYYLTTRYYDPEVCRFISADVYMTTGQGVLGGNMWAYCGNNPVVRYEVQGKFWGLVAKVVVGIASQYVSDVIGNLISGKTGWDILKPTSSIGEYVAAGVTALIPGSGFGAALARNTVTEGIKSVEKVIRGEEVNIGQSAVNIVVSSAVDVIGEKVTAKVEQALDNLSPRNYSSYAGKQYKKNPGITQSKIRKKMRRVIQTVQIAKAVTSTGINITRSLLPY